VDDGLLTPPNVAGTICVWVAAGQTGGSREGMYVAAAASSAAADPIQLWLVGPHTCTIMPCCPLESRHTTRDAVTCGVVIIVTRQDKKLYTAGTLRH
jgi:hypothetical protein